MVVTVTKYLRAIGIPNGHEEILDTLREIKRTPRVKAHIKKPVRAFVDFSLRPISDKLWDGVPDAQILKFMDESQIDTKAGEGKKKRPALRFIDPHKGHRRSDWNICKPTNAR